MVSFVVYTNTGEILKTGRTSDINFMLHHKPKENKFVMIGKADDMIHRVEVDKSGIPHIVKRRNK